MSRRSQAEDLEAQINAQTDMIFAQATGRPFGQKIRRGEPDANALIHAWLSIRYEVAQRVASQYGI